MYRYVDLLCMMFFILQEERNNDDVATRLFGDTLFKGFELEVFLANPAGCGRAIPKLKAKEANHDSASSDHSHIGRSFFEGIGFGMGVSRKGCRFLSSRTRNRTSSLGGGVGLNDDA